MREMNIKIFKSLFFFILCGLALSVHAVAQNRISGTVYNEAQRPVSDVDVELLDEFERFVTSERTRGSGVYTFQNLRAGVFYVHVRNNGQNYVDQKIRIPLGEQNRTVTTPGGARVTGVDFQQVDIYLKLDPRIMEKNERLRNEVIFAQEIPESAKAIFESAVEFEQAKDPQRALKEYARALDIFPDYFLALFRFGSLCLTERLYDVAEIAFDRASRINARSSNSLFQLAVVQNLTNKQQDAEANLLKAIEINSDMISYFLLLGIVQRNLGKFDDSEKSLRKADELSNGTEPDVHWNLGLLYFNNLKRYKEAANQLELYLKTAKSIPADEKAKIKKTIASIKKKAENPD